MSVNLGGSIWATTVLRSRSVSTCRGVREGLIAGAHLVSRWSLVLIIKCGGVWVSNAECGAKGELS